MYNEHENIAKKTIWLRIAQTIINDHYRNGEFKIPIHLAMGHEAIAVAVDSVMQKNDILLLTHRNAHYNLARQGTLKEELDEYYLRKEGLAQGHLGSMNLNNPKRGIPYTSSILGNNMPVACGYAFGNKVKRTKAATFVVTGDGALEEGAFYESLLFMSSYDLSVILIIENNDWSLGTRTNERRAQIKIDSLLKGLEIEYVYIDSNDVLDYFKQIERIKTNAIENARPIVVEVKLTTLGYWSIQNEQFPKGKFVNYHSGPAPTVAKVMWDNYPVIKENEEDPLHILKKYYTKQELINFSNDALNRLMCEFS